MVEPGVSPAHFEVGPWFGSEPLTRGIYDADEARRRNRLLRVASRIGELGSFAGSERDRKGYYDNVTHEYSWMLS